MNRRGLLGWGGVALLMIAAFGTLSYPVWRLERERAGTLAEGLALTRADLPSLEVPVSLNAAPLIERARATWRKHGDPWMRAHPIIGQGTKVIAGKATAKERASVKAWSLAHQEVLAAWQAASRKPFVEFGDKDADRWSQYSPSLTNDRYAISSLIAAAAVGVESRENTLVAARLAALMRREGEINPVATGSRLGIECLTVAKRFNLQNEVVAALGPRVEVRDALRAELCHVLSMLESLHGRSSRKRDFAGWIDRVLRPPETLEAVAIARWRAIWKALPPGVDYKTALQVLDERLPAVAELTALRSAKPMSLTIYLAASPQGMRQAMNDIARFEAMRESFR